MTWLLTGLTQAGIIVGGLGLRATLSASYFYTPSFAQLVELLPLGSLLLQGAISGVGVGLGAILSSLGARAVAREQSAVRVEAAQIHLETFCCTDSTFLFHTAETTPHWKKQVRQVLSRCSGQQVGGWCERFSLVMFTSQSYQA